MISSKTGIALLTALMVGSMVFGATPAPERDAGIQARISAVVAAAVDAPGTTLARVQDLQDATEGQREALLLQLALFLSESDSTEKAMVGAALVHELGFTPQEKLAAVEPHLETKRTSLRKVLAEILGTIDRPEGGTPDFGFYEEVLTPSGRERHAALIRYMYGTSPLTALDSMTRVFDVGGATPPNPADVAALDDIVARLEGPVSLSNRELAEVVRILDRLAADPSWWVRLYVAAVLQQQPELGTSDQRARLATDQDALVRGVAQVAPAPR